MENRKDKTASETIQRIRLVLQRLGIKTINTETLEYPDGWASYRLEIDGTPGVGTNGKGVGKEYAEASAYAEFMERLASFHLVHNFYPRMHRSPPTKQNFCLDDLLVAASEIGDPFYHVSESLGEVIKNNSSYQSLEDYYNVFEDRVVTLPQWFIDANCGTNGLCAGNTAEEAILQGINEILERFARRLYFEKSIPAFTIPDEDLQELQSWKMVCEIRNLGYYCVVKDFTCGGKYPVLGVLLADSNKEYYLVSLGSDFDIDICLQRCITELFQGRKLDMWFKLHLNRTYERDLFYASPSAIESDICYQMNVSNNTGNYPLSIFDQTVCDTSYRKAFVGGRKSNKELLTYVLSLLKEHNKRVYIHDYGHLGFPVYRVFIPGMSEISNLAQLIISNRRYFEDFGSLYYNPQKLTIEKVESFTNAVEKLSRLPFFKVDNLISTVTNMPVLEDKNNIGINDINVLVALFSFCVKKYETAYIYYRKYIDEKTKDSYVRLSSTERAILVTFRCFKDGLGWGSINPILESLNCSNIKNLLTKPDELFRDLPRCPNCNLCKVRNCYYEKLNNIADRISLCVTNDQEMLRSYFETLI